MKFVTRAYNNFTLNEKTKASVIKTSAEKRLKGEVEYYLHLPKELEIYFPRMLDYSLKEPYSLELEYYAYNNLGLAMVDQDFSPEFWEKVFDFLFSYLELQWPTRK